MAQPVYIKRVTINDKPDLLLFVSICSLFTSCVLLHILHIEYSENDFLLIFRSLYFSTVHSCVSENSLSTLKYNGYS
jgi:hypothetical protein